MVVNADVAKSDVTRFRDGIEDNATTFADGVVVSVVVARGVLLRLDV